MTTAAAEQAAEQAKLHEEHRATPRHFLMCRPTYFDVTYAINPWMDPARPVDKETALAQWDGLRRTYEELGHRVDVLEPSPGLPDMVFAANAATIVDGKAFGARFRNAERQPEAPAYAAGLADIIGEPYQPEHINEGEGDFLVVGERILAGTGFRTEQAAHLEAQEYFGRPVVSLQLVDPRYYHLDTAVTALDEHTIAYYPEAFSPASRRVLQQLFPEAITASAPDAEVLGLNAVSDGYHVVLSGQASGLASALAERGYQPVPVDMSELLKAGGGAKCCTLEIRR